MGEMLMEMGRCVLGTGRVLAGLAILEDGFDRTAEIHALRPGEIPKKEPELLARSRRYFPRLPVDDLNVLVVSEMGKNFSGTGLDTNVIGYRGMRGGEDLSGQVIRIIAVLGLTPESQGNAIGVGLADVITRRLRDAIDEGKTFVNVMTTGELIRAKIPVTLENDEALVQTLLDRYGPRRWMFIANTLHLERLYVSEDLAGELRAGGECRLDPAPQPLTFAQGRLGLAFE
jgi:hypothetical protein